MQYKVSFYGNNSLFCKVQFTKQGFYMVKITLLSMYLTRKKGDMSEIRRLSPLKIFSGTREIHIKKGR